MNALLVASRTGGPDKGGWGPVGRLDYADGAYRFVYTQGARSLQGFRPFHGMEDLNQIYQSDELFPVFKNRLMPESRPEYQAYLRWSGFDSSFNPDDPLAPISILGVTEGIRQTDYIEVFPCPVPDLVGCYVNKFFVHGLRYLPLSSHVRLSQMEEGERLAMMPDPWNESDSSAVALRTTVGERMLVGYVPRYLAHDIWELYSGCHPEYMSIVVERVNVDAPLQQRLLCRMNSCWPEGFQPCSTEEFRPIPEGVAVRCEGEHALA
ncbi:MAG: HIRAN domain-containing protein [Luteolibacter sp.]